MARGRRRPRRSPGTTPGAASLPEGWDADLPVFKPEDRAVATRVRLGQGHQRPGAAPARRSSAAPPTSRPPTTPDQGRARPAGRHARRAATSTSACASSPWPPWPTAWPCTAACRPYVATFFVFVDYMRPAMRLSALMGQPVIYVLTHDSIGVGEDGPTHQPIEHLAMLRATPGFIDLRPADANETVEAWKIALQTRRRARGPHADASEPADDRPRRSTRRRAASPAAPTCSHDASGGGAPDVILMASGSEVALALEAHERLVAEGVRSRLVNMASMRLFEQQDADYRESVLPLACSRGWRSRPASPSAGSAGSATAARSSASTTSAPRPRPGPCSSSSASPPTTSTRGQGPAGLSLARRPRRGARRPRAGHHGRTAAPLAGRPCRVPGSGAGARRRRPAGACLNRAPSRSL